MNSLASQPPIPNTPAPAPSVAKLSWVFVLVKTTPAVLRAQEQGFARDVDPEHTALAISLLFERFTTVYLRPDTTAFGVVTTDENAVRTLSTIWKKTLYGY